MSKKDKSVEDVVAAETRTRAKRGSSGFVMVKVTTAIYDKARSRCDALSAKLSAEAGMPLKVTPSSVIQRCLAENLK